MSDVSAKMMEIFKEAGDGFYNLKELEKMSKSKGIDTTKVKDILQSLVYDEKIESDKIGSTLFYWSFPEKKIEEDKKKSDELKLKNKELNDKMETLMALVKEREETKEKVGDYEKTRRDEIIKHIEELKVKEKDLMEYLNNNDNMSVDEINKLSIGIKNLTLAVNRWTDNIFNMKSWFKKKYPAIEDAQLEKEFRIPSEFDYFSPN